MKNGDGLEQGLGERGFFDGKAYLILGVIKIYVILQEERLSNDGVVSIGSFDVKQEKAFVLDEHQVSQRKACDTSIEV